MLLREPVLARRQRSRAPLAAFGEAVDHDLGRTGTHEVEPREQPAEGPLGVKVPHFFPGLRGRAAHSALLGGVQCLGPDGGGWLARVQSLAKVVTDEGTIELSLFAKAKDAAVSAQQK